MNKPNRNMPLSKTNYFANLRRKASCKDEKEQEIFNKEVLNCISILDGKIASIEENLEKILRSQTEFSEAISDGISGIILPHLRAIEEVIGPEKIREVFEKNKNRDFEKPSDDEKSGEN